MTTASQTRALELLRYLLSPSDGSEDPAGLHRAVTEFVAMDKAPEGRAALKWAAAVIRAEQAVDLEDLDDSSYLAVADELPLFVDDDSITLGTVLRALRCKADADTGAEADALFLALDPEGRRAEWSLYWHALRTVFVRLRDCYHRGGGHG